MSVNLPPCEVAGDEDVDCLECLDTGRIQTAGVALPCLTCPAGDRWLYHDITGGTHAPSPNPAEADHHQANRR